MANRLAEAFRRVRRGELGLAGLLSRESIEGCLTEAGYVDGGSVYTAIDTLWLFLGQTLAVDGSCQQAVCEGIAQRVSQGKEACSSDTGGYCKARKRLPEDVYWALQRETGRWPDESPADWKWCDRDVKIVDGSTLKIPETAANLMEYPLQSGIQPGTSYPVVRILVVLCYAIGTVLEADLQPIRGKGTGENGMLRGLADRFAADDVLLGDRGFSGYWDIAWWRNRGVDIVTRRNARRTSDYRRGTRLGRGDHLVTWNRTARPDWLSPEEAAAIPRTLTLREVRVQVRQVGFRTKTIHVITTLLDAAAYPASKLAALYRRRWQAELDLRSLKTHLGMEQLRTKSPGMIRKEFAMHLIAYNAVRRVAAEAAAAAGREPREISFQGTRQSLAAFLPKLHARTIDDWLDALLSTAGTMLVGQRPDRLEPYATKRRPKPYPPLQEPRANYKNRFHSTT